MNAIESVIQAHVVFHSSTWFPHNLKCNGYTTYILLSQSQYEGSLHTWPFQHWRRITFRSAFIFCSWFICYLAQSVKTFAIIFQNMVHKFIFLPVNNNIDCYLYSKTKIYIFPFLKNILRMGKFNKHVTKFDSILRKSSVTSQHILGMKYYISPSRIRVIAGQKWFLLSDTDQHLLKHQTNLVCSKKYFLSVQLVHCGCHKLL
jgi:hypothetical protein